jgi:ABC-2 type transport system ATP-binding protein
VIVVEAAGDARVAALIQLALTSGAQVVEVTPRRETLEDLFMRRAL